MPGKNTTIYDNFYLANEVEDQFLSHLNLQQFCTVDSTLAGVPGMKKTVHTYKATDGTEKLEIGAGNTKSIAVSYTSKDYEILLAQNRFEWYDEEEMKDPMLVPVGVRHTGTDLFNTVNKDIFAEFGKTEQTVETKVCNFDALVDAQAEMKLENLAGVSMFGLVSPADMATVRKSLHEHLQYVEPFALNGYVGTVAGIHLYTKKDATPGEIIIATKDAVTLFLKPGVEIERVTAGSRSEDAANTRLNTIFTRKYYLAALTDGTKAVKITVSGG